MKEQDKYKWKMNNINIIINIHVIQLKHFISILS